MVKVKVNTIIAEGTLAYEGCNIAIARAPNGTIWAMYLDDDFTLPEIYVAYSSNGGNSWTEELALTDGRTAAPGYSSGKTFALMVDSNSVPHIIFIGLNAADTNAGRIRYFNRVGGSWGAVETIISADAGTNILGLSSCIDSTNTFHLIARAVVSTVGAVYYWSGTTGSWSAAQSIDAAGGAGDITITSANLPICIYNDAGGIKFNTRSGGTWANEETISTDTGGYTGNKLVVDSANDVHVVWNEIFGTGGWVGIKYRKRTSGVWGTEQIVVNGDTNGVDSYGYPLLGIDSSDNVYVVYQYDQSTTEEETVWYKQIVSEVVGTEIVLDDNILQPNTYPSPYAILYHRFPNSGILSSSVSPAVLLLHENGVDADVYFEAGAFLLAKPRIFYF